uniref:Uncharacterized protein n=1 Tax=Bartonella schoenbuchensis (strain DSM 13525 / NCTC 13165 / R1) TaxID=687861 RepID=E6Z0F0_BARSR|nr:hypothetical protein B11C_40443 [Bartonella schoenbuchensis R1]
MSFFIIWQNTFCLIHQFVSITAPLSLNAIQESYDFYAQVCYKTDIQ